MKSPKVMELSMDFFLAWLECDECWIEDPPDNDGWGLACPFEVWCMGEEL